MVVGLDSWRGCLPWSSPMQMAPRRATTKSSSTCRTPDWNHRVWSRVARTMRAPNRNRPATWLSSLVAVAAACCPWGTDEPVAESPQAVEIVANEPAPQRLRPQRIERRLSLGWQHSCLPDDEGGLGCWGSYLSLEELEAGLAGVESPVVALHSRFAGEGCVVIEGGRVRCWNDDLEDPPWLVEGIDDAIALDFTRIDLDRASERADRALLDGGALLLQRRRAGRDRRGRRRAWRARGFRLCTHPQRSRALLERPDQG
jgi:hypothetical protein